MTISQKQCGSYKCWNSRYRHLSRAIVHVWRCFAITEFMTDSLGYLTHTLHLVISLKESIPSHEQNMTRCSKAIFVCIVSVTNTREFDRSTPTLAWCGSDIYHLASYVTMTKTISPKSVRKEIPFHVMGSCAFIGNIYSFPQTVQF